MKKVFHLVLGSGSPRRKELLGHIGLNFDVVSLDVDESIDESLNLTPKEVVEDLSKRKLIAAKNWWEQSDFKDYGLRPFLITSDTLVNLGDEILGKPTSRDHAREMLQKMLGQTHKVFTGVGGAWKDENGDWQEFLFSDLALVTFSDLDDHGLESYLASEEPYDKAGSYGIQGAALSFIEKLEGSYSTVMGLPLSLTRKKIEEVVRSTLGESLQVSDDWRKVFKS
ncbi:MAG: Maf family protein [Bacteriovoracaceae bacterium]